MRRFLAQSIFIGAALMIFFVRSYAQSGVAPGVIEKTLEQSRPVFVTPPQVKAPEIIIKDSRKLKDPGAGPAFLVNKIIIEGNTLIGDETLAPLVDVEGGMEVTLGILALMANEITALYATKGYFLTGAFVPPQEIIDGVVKIKIMEGSIGKITVKGNKKYDAKDFLYMMKSVQEEKVLREQTLENTLLELNSMLGINTRSILRPGELPGTSDLVLNVTESRRYLFSYDMDNFGSQLTGSNRFGLTGTVGNILTLGDKFSTRWVTSDMVQDSYSPSYIFPVNHLGTKVRLAYTFSENELGRGLKSLASGGTSHTYTWELSHLLSKIRTSQITVRGGMDFKIFKNEQNGVPSSKENLQDTFFGLGGNFSDKYGGQTFYDIKLQLGLRLFETSLRIPSREGGNDNSSIDYTDPFPKKIKLFKGFPTLDQILSFNTFFDSGRVFVRNKLPTETSDEDISSFGAGLTLNIPKKENKYPGFSFAVSYGVPVPGGKKPSDTSWGTVYLSGLINY